ncbi:radial spokehead-like protein [Catenaria anguillulae PL171]|uniref:Radial spokehead-like protein n=1 Tax=Catenaria anguillulae PL171 TaxID=765915 RepID=A0A1Y2HAV2_9FUNG|nr:radial spokehead-like protein [Catenaria anguillulae PL171]
MDDIASAKQYLQQHSDRTGINLYDHLTDLVASLLERRPKNPADVFEGVSAQLKRKRFNLDALNAPLGYNKVPDTSQAHQGVHKLVALLQASTKNTEDQADDGAGQVPDILDLAHLFESTGVSLGKEETLFLALAIHQLVKDQGLQSARFWGKIHGTEKSYYIVEAEGGPSEEDAAAAAAAATPASTDAAAAKEAGGGGGDASATASTAPVDPAKLIDMPEFQGFKAPAKPVVHEVPKEEGTGCNKYTYFVCTSLGDSWTRLPDTHPSHISTARTLRKLLTGHLSRPICSYPPFPAGLTEAHYLRAQIARITASTVVCPQGYYTFDPEAADEEHPELNTAIIVNAEYEVLPNDAMLSLDNWVHQMPHVLPQGRTVWVNPVPEKEEGDEGGEGGDGGGGGDEEAEEKDEDEDEEDGGDSGNATRGDAEQEIEPESGPALLTAVTEDAEVCPGVASWSVRACSRLLPVKFSPVHLRSNRWPGAHAVYYNGKFACVYVGDGIKELGSTPFTLPAVPKMRAEYAVPAKWAGKVGLTEKDDPSVADEKAFEEMLKQKEDDAMPDEDDGAGGEGDGAGGDDQ